MIIHAREINIGDRTEVTNIVQVFIVYTKYELYIFGTYIITLSLHGLTMHNDHNHLINKNMSLSKPSI